MTEPKTASEYLDRGCDKDDKKDSKGAIKDYTKAIELNPKYAEAYANRGCAKEELGDKEGALADWQKAADLGDEEAAKWIGEVKEKDRRKLLEVILHCDSSLVESQCYENEYLWEHSLTAENEIEITLNFHDPTRRNSRFRQDIYKVEDFKDFSDEEFCSFLGVDYENVKRIERRYESDSFKEWTLERAAEDLRKEYELIAVDFQIDSPEISKGLRAIDNSSLEKLIQLNIDADAFELECYEEGEGSGCKIYEADTETLQILWDKVEELLGIKINDSETGLKLFYRLDSHFFRQFWSELSEGYSSSANDKGHINEIYE